MSNIILTKRIGTTTYTVNVHFNQNATETMEEKFLRIISDYPLANGEKMWYNRCIANEPFSLKGVLLNDKQADGTKQNYSFIREIIK